MKWYVCFFIVSLFLSLYVEIGAADVSRGGKSGKVSAAGRSMKGGTSRTYLKSLKGRSKRKLDPRSKRDDDDDYADNDDESESEKRMKYIENGKDDNDGLGDEEYDNDDDVDESSKSRHPSLARPKVPRKKSSGSFLEKGIDLSSEAATFAVKMTKGSIKSAVDLVAAKHVTLRQICGKWRISQEIEVKKGIFVNCPATIEIKEDGTITTTFDDQEFKSEFIFKERAWPRKCTIQFNARAFQGPGDAEPRNMYYKGFFKRSLLNPNIVFIRGKVYRLSGKMFWKAQNKCGKFKAVCTKKRYHRR